MATGSASIGPKRGSCRLFLYKQLAFRRTAARGTSINALAGPVSCCGRTHPVCRSGFKYTKNADIPVFLPGITRKRPAERFSERAIRLWTGNYADKTTGAATESASVGPKRGSCRLFLVQQLAFRRTAARGTSINALAGPVSCCGRTHPVCRSGFKCTTNTDIPVPESPVNGLPSALQSAQYVSGRVIMRIRPRERQRRAPPLGQKGARAGCFWSNSWLFAAQRPVEPQ